MQLTTYKSRLLHAALISIVVMAVTFLLPIKGKSKDYVSHQSSQSVERTLIPREFPDGVIKLVSTSNLSSPTFPKGFTFDVKNVSDKPIYFVWLVVLFPGAGQYVTPPISGKPLGISIEYGNPKFIESRGALADTSDISIQPGETHTFKLDENQASRVYELIKESNFGFGSTVYIACSRVCFGDGTDIRSSNISYKDSKNVGKYDKGKATTNRLTRLTGFLAPKANSKSGSLGIDGNSTISCDLKSRRA